MESQNITRGQEWIMVGSKNFYRPTPNVLVFVSVYRTYFHEDCYGNFIEEREESYVTIGCCRLTQSGRRTRWYIQNVAGDFERLQSMKGTKMIAWMPITYPSLANKELIHDNSVSNVKDGDEDCSHKPIENALFSEVVSNISIVEREYDLHEISHVKGLFWSEESIMLGTNDWEDYKLSQLADDYDPGSRFENYSRDFKRKIAIMQELDDVSLIVMENGESHFVIGKASEIAKKIMDLGRKLIFPPSVYLEDGTKKEKYEEGDLAWYDTREWYAFGSED